MKPASIVCLLLALIAVPLSVHADPPAPTMECTIEKPLNQHSGTPVSYDVSNLDFIIMNVPIDTKGGGTIEAGGAVAINPTGTLPANYLVIAATKFSAINVPINARITGTGPTGYIVTFWLPEDQTTRTTKEQACIDRMKATDTKSSSTSRDWVNANNDKALASIDSIYTQSQVGAFTITVKYVSTGSGLWNGTVQGAPIIVNVLNKGSQLDNLPN